jgi:hypothetical protein
VEHHHSKQNKPLFWICQSTSCTCHSDLKTEQHWIYIHETRKVWDTSMYTVSRRTFGTSHIQTHNQIVNLQFAGHLCMSIGTVTVRTTLFSDVMLSRWLRMSQWRAASISEAEQKH